MDRWSELKQWLIEHNGSTTESLFVLEVLSKMREIEERDRREMRAIYQTPFDGED